MLYVIGIDRGPAGIWWLSPTGRWTRDVLDAAQFDEELAACIFNPKEHVLRRVK